VYIVKLSFLLVFTRQMALSVATSQLTNNINDYYNDSWKCQTHIIVDFHASWVWQLCHTHITLVCQICQTQVT
jgi:hypothetical protein